MTPPKPANRYTIRITATPNSLNVTVRGAIYGDDQTAIALVDGVTPIDVSVGGRTVVGMLQAVDPAFPIMVDVMSADSETEPRLVVRARARTVLLGENVRPNTGMFIRGG